MRANLERWLRDHAGASFILPEAASSTEAMWTTYACPVEGCDYRASNALTLAQHVDDEHPDADESPV